MTGFMDIYTLIFLVLAVVIFFKIRSVLGQRTGSERPPFDPFSRRPAAPDAAETGKVIPLPRSADAAAPVAVPPAEDRIASAAPAGTPLANSLRAIAEADKSFDPQQFLDGARTAYEMIVTAFAKGDTATLKPLLGRDVYDGFAKAIADRQSRGETVEFNFVGLDKAEIADASLKGGTAQVTIRFASKLVSATRDKDGAVVDGDPVHTADVTDLWTFAREAASKDPNWALVATESVE
jgi:predicted lipid-binding transport protein (Tim44 family)